MSVIEVTEGKIHSNLLDLFTNDNEKVKNLPQNHSQSTVKNYGI